MTSLIIFQSYIQKITHYPFFSRMSEEDIFNDIKPMFCLAKASGFISSKLKRSNANRKYLVHDACHYQFSIALQLVVFICGCINLKEFLKVGSQASNTTLFFILNIVSELIFTIYCFVCCVCSKLYVKKNQRFWQELYNIDNHMQMRNIRIDHKFLRIVASINVTVVVILPSVCTGFYAIHDAEKEEMTRIHYIAKHMFLFYSTMSYALLHCQYMASFNIINQMLYKLEEITRKQFLSCSYKQPKPAELLKTAKLHRRICELSRDGNDVISVQLLFGFIELMCLFSVAAFSSIVSIINNTYIIRDVINIVWVVVSCIGIVLATIVAHKCIEKVSGSI